MAGMAVPSGMVILASDSGFFLLAFIISIIVFMLQASFRACAIVLAETVPA
jgi:hypothetical protein